MHYCTPVDTGRAFTLGCLQKYPSSSKHLQLPLQSAQQPLGEARPLLCSQPCALTPWWIVRSSVYQNGRAALNVWQDELIAAGNMTASWESLLILCCSKLFQDNAN